MEAFIHYLPLGFIRSAGFTGLQILQHVFTADTSDRLNRALFGYGLDPMGDTRRNVLLAGDDSPAISSKKERKTDSQSRGSC
ncbi:Uu.00g001150.m01.CDS01 [Anthostomella pinea]|uniref:Uu.00g001150.m01.CDS01 n=1 Tax=Anthostomella pinea TaxID=933095 RepID=A0AAI8YID8_9PEZI|nr:Uu.00g001150.m01.CDS01 [Anthostomella pinea]